MISYSRHDRDAAEAMASSLSAFGMEVWWDIALTPGKSYAREIDAIARDVDHILVLWSEHAVASDWVVAEATLAQDLGKLVPLKISPCEPLVNFRSLHTLTTPWSSAQHRFENLDGLVASLLGQRVHAPQSGSEFSDKDISCIPARELVTRALRRRTWDQIDADGARDDVSLWLGGAALMDGIGRASDPARGMSIVSACARAGLARALHSEAICYLDGIGVTRDETRGLALLHAAAEQNVGLSLYQLGIWRLRGARIAKDVNAGVQFIHRAALLGHTGAQAELGSCYRSGIGVPKDNREAIHWFETAAREGETFALCMLAAIAADGDFPGKGDDYAAQQFQAAYHAGDKGAAMSLGSFYAEKRRPTFDLAKAATWFKRAGDGGNAEGHANAALIIMGNYETLNDIADPVYMLAQAADAKYPPALVYLGEALLEPKLRPIDKVGARDAFKAALAAGGLSPDLTRRAHDGLRRAAALF